MARMLRPTSDRVLIEPLEEIPSSSIFIPEISREKPTQGIVRQIGPGRTREDGVLIPVELCIGDKVIFQRYTAGEIKIEDKPMMLIRESEVIAILT